MWNFIKNLGQSVLGFLLPGLSNQIFGLSKAEREQNQFNADQAAIARQFEAEQVQNQMNFQSLQAQNQMGFQERMANSQWQRGVNDMQAAGLNPALAYNQGGAVAPSGVAMQGAAGSAVAASGSGRGVPVTMSEILASMKLRKEMDLLESQRKNLDEDSEKKAAETRRIQIEADWLPKMYAADLDVKEGTLEKYSAEVASLLASAEGQRIINEWNPRLFASQLENDKVNRLHTVAGIHKIEQEIKNLISQNENIFQDTNVKILTQGLIAAQTALANQQTAEVSAKTWRQEFENSFTELYGHKPDEPVWNAVTTILGEWSGKMREGAEGFKRLVSSAWHKATNYDPYSFGNRHQQD